MSLTKILDKPAVRAALKDRIRMPRFPFTHVRAPAQAENPSRVGIAFDYALRFGLHAHGWGDEPKTLMSRAVDTLRRHPHLRGDQGQVRHIGEEASAILSTMNAGELTDEQARACLNLGGLDVVVRAGRVDQIGVSPTQLELQDMHALFAIVPWQGFRPTTRLAPNPSFGAGSRAIGGADADLILDDTLIEIKVVAERTVQMDALRQLVAYTLLARRFGIDGLAVSSPIDQIGVYLARCGTLVTAPFADVIRPEDEDAVLDVILSAWP